MDAADLRIFQCVARCGSMNKAATELNTVQSNVTARIKALEDELGFELFERTHRGVTLTAGGKRLLPFADRGPLVIGSLDTTAALRLSPILAEFARSYPAVDLTLRTGTTAELIDQVLNHS